MDTEQDPVEIPYDALSPEALRGVIESFVLRVGTEYGDRDFTLLETVDQVLQQLKRREARVMFDPATETVTVQRTR